MNKVVGTRVEWLAARTVLLAEEKELTRRSDELARKRGVAFVAVLRAPLENLQAYKREYE